MSLDLEHYPRKAVRGGVFTLLPGSILVAEPTEHNVGLEEAKEMVQAMRDLAGGEKFRLLLDQRGLKRKMDGAARKYFNVQGAFFERLAIVTGSAVSRFFASGVLMLIGLQCPARSFDSFDAAIAWLREP